MLQKLSKCEVKPWVCWRLIIITPHWFYIKPNFGEFKWSKNVIFGNFSNFRDSELWIFGKTSKIAKNDIFGPFEFAKIWFHVKSERRLMIKSQQSQALTSHFESFWSIVAGYSSISMISKQFSKFNKPTFTNPSWTKI